MPNPIPPILTDHELARRESASLTVRTTPLRIRLDLADLPTADAHALHLSFTFSVLPRPEPAERTMLRETFLAQSQTCAAPDVAKFLLPPVSAAARALLATRPVTDWLTDTAKSDLTTALIKSTNAATFICGLEVLPPYQLHLDSPTLQRAQLEQTTRAAAQRAHDDRLTHLRHSAEVLKEFESLRAASPTTPLSTLLTQVSPTDQPHLLTSLLAAAPPDHSTLHAIAGPHLIKISPDGTPEEIPTPSTLGPFRSLQQITLNAQPTLAIGARTGLLLLPPTGPLLFPAPDLDSPLGFNRIVPHANRLIASHSEAGLLIWDPANPSTPPTRISLTQIGGTPTEGPRNLTPVGSNLLFSLAGQLFSLDDSLSISSTPHTGEPIIALLPTPRHLLAIRANGDIDTLDPQTLDLLTRTRHSSRISAATLLPFYDSPRLLLAPEEGPLLCLSPDDPLLTTYPTPHQGLRALAASPTQIAALSPDRQRLLFIDPTHRNPPQELHLGSRYRHRLADLTFFPT